VPSWKLVTEVYDPVKLQTALQKFAEAYSRETVKAGNAPLRISQEVFEGRTYYFHDLQCRDDFERQPAMYVGSERSER